MKTSVYTTFIFSGALCAVLMAVGFIFCPGILHLIDTPTEIYADSLAYLEIYIGGLFFLFFYNIATGIFSAMGDSRTPFIFLAVSSVANVFVDILFVTAFDMGVSGVAWATFLCQMVSCLASLAALFIRLSKVKTEGKIKKFSLPIFKKILTVSVPSILQQSFISVGNVCVQGVINGYGSSVIAGYSAAVKINAVAITSFTSIANGISSFAAQNFGAKKNHRIKEGFTSGVKMTFLLCVPFVAIFTLFGGFLMNVFMDSPTEAAVNTGIMFLLIISPFYFVVSLKIIADGILRGTGDMVRFMITTFTDLMLRVVFSFVFSEIFDVNGIWAAWPTSWCISTVMSLAFLYKNFKKNNVLKGARS